MSDEEDGDMYASEEEINDQAHDGGSERWRPSPPPSESFSDAEGANEKGEWTFEIVGEEVDEDGSVSIEVRWDDWNRADGTKTTWNGLNTVNSGSWQTSQTRARKELAAESLEIEIWSTVDVHNSETFLRSQAYAEKLQLYDAAEQVAQKEARRLKQEYQPDVIRQLDKLQAKRQGTSTLPENQGSSSSSSFPMRSSQRASTRQQTEQSLASSSSSLRRGSSMRSTATVGMNKTSSSGSFQTTPAPSSKASSSQAPLSKRTVTLSEQSISPSPPLISMPSGGKGKGKRLVLSSEDGDSDSSQKLPKSTRVTNSPRERPIVLLTPRRKRVKRAKVIASVSDGDSVRVASCSTSSRSVVKPIRPSPASTNILSSQDRRMKMQNDWIQLAAKEGAAPIYIANEVDDEAVPLLCKNFCYSESKYQFALDTSQDYDDFLSGCSCQSCISADECDCPDAEQLLDKNGVPCFAYTSSGYFTFNMPRGSEVVECNKRCRCASNPLLCMNRVSQRPRDVPIEVFKTERRGWGVRPLINIRRGKVLGLYTGLVVPRYYDIDVEDKSAYVFDLDGNEAAGGLLSVDAKEHGNWTRFVNHSCSPNLQVYLVVHDVPAGVNRPFIAFVATCDIPAKTEFTVDYDPEAGEEYVLRQAEMKKKGKRKRARSISGISVTEVEIPEGTKKCMCGSDGCRGYVAC